MMLLILRFLPHFFLCLGFKYSTHHPVFRHPESVLLSEVDRIFNLDTNEILSPEKERKVCIRRTDGTVRSNAFKRQEVAKDMNKIIDTSLARVSRTRNPCSHASDDVISVRIEKFRYSDVTPHVAKNVSERGAGLILARACWQTPDQPDYYDHCLLSQGCPNIDLAPSFVPYNDGSLAGCLTTEDFSMGHSYS